MSQRARDAIGPFLEQFAELHPCTIEKQSCWAINVTALVDCFDEVHSTTEPIMDAYGKGFSLDPSRFGSAVFKIPQTRRSYTYSLSGTGNPDGEFEALVAKHGLTGLFFFPIWSDDPAVPVYGTEPRPARTVVPADVVDEKKADAGDAAAAPEDLSDLEVYEEDESEKALKRMRKWVASEHGRPAWGAVLDDADRANSPFPGEIPTCGRCGDALELQLQLDLGRLPKGCAAARPGHVLQFYFCGRNDCFAMHYGNAFGANLKVRVVPSGGAKVPHLLYVLDESGDEGHLVPVTKWGKFRDLPSEVELATLGVRYDDASGSLVCRPLGFRAAMEWDEYHDFVQDEGLCDEGEKLGGWPCWKQGIDYPECPQCGSAMTTHVYQIVPVAPGVEFGDGLQGHLLACPQHPDVVGYVSASG